MCSYTDSIELFVFTPEAFDSLTASPMTICAGDSATILAIPGTIDVGPYCASNATSLADTKIDTVSLGGVTTGTAPLNGGEAYTDNSSVIIPLIAGNQHPLTIVKGDQNGPATYAAWAKVFIDFDQNGTYDPAEEVYSFGAPAATGPIGGLITIPANAINGATGMRVVLNEGGSAASTTACGTFTWGETEDYTVMISGGVPNTNAGFAFIDWTPATSLSSITGDSVVAQGLLATTMYTAIGTDPNGCMDTAMVTITVNPAPAVMASADTTICSGDSTTLSATGADIYVWMPGALMGDMVSVAPTATTSYIVTGTDTTTMCSWNDTVTVTVPDVFIVNASATPMAICAGDSVNLMAADSVAAVPPYCTAVFNNTGDTKIDSTNINGIATFTAGLPGAAEVYTDYTSIVVPVTAGTTFPMSVTKGSASTSTYSSWVKIYIDLDQNGVFDLPGEEFLSAAAGGFGSGAFTVPTNITIPTTALNGPTRMRIVLRETTLASQVTPCGPYADWGETEDYTLDITGGVAPVAYTYAWDPGALAGAMQTVTPTATTSYIVTQTHPVTGCEAMDTVEVMVTPLPVLAVSASPSTSVCMGDTVTLMSGAAATDSVIWNAITMATDTILAPAVAGNYTVVAYDSTGMCSVTDSIMVTVNMPLPFDSLVASPMTICAGDSTAIQAFPGVSGGTYCASGGTSNFDTHIDSSNINGIITVATPLNSGGTYTDNTGSVTIPVTAGTAFPLSVTKGVTGTSTYTAWVKVYIDLDQNGVFDLPGEEFTSATAGAFGSGRFTTTDTLTIPTTALNGPTRMRIVMRETGTASLVAPCGTFTYGETEDYTIDISGGVPSTPTFASITWSPATALNTTSGDSVNAQGLMATTTYTATGTDMNGCMSMDSVTIMVNPLPTITASATPAAICVGDTAMLMGGGTATDYVWNSGMLMGANQTVTPTMTTAYTLTGTDSVTGCSVDSTVSVMVNALPMLTVTVDSNETCPGAMNGGATAMSAGVPNVVYSEGFVNTFTSQTNLPNAALPGWTNTSTANPRWALETNATGSGYGASSGANTPGYVYLEATSPATVGQTDTLTSPSITVPTGTGINLSFFTHMYGNGIGSMVLLIDNGTTLDSVWSVSGQQQTSLAAAWDSVSVSLDAYAGQNINLRYVGIRGTGFDGDAALDDIQISTPTSNSLLWSNSDTTESITSLTAGTYTVTATNAAGCMAMDSAVITANPAPMVTVTPTPGVNNCFGGAVDLIAMGASTYVWMPGSATGDTLSVPAYTPTTTYMVTGTDSNGCEDTASVTVTQTFPSGNLTQATPSNSASNPGTQCDTYTQPNNGLMYSYHDTSCAIIASVQEPNGGASLGTVTTCATVDATNQVYQGQPYVARHFDITPTNNGPADVTLYFTDDDFADYNNARGTFDSIATNAGGNTTAQICITQVSGGPLGTGTPTVHGPLTATWNASTMRWDVTFPVTGFSEFYCHTCNTSNAALAVDYKSFTVTKQATSDLVEWTTASEQNSKLFNVQRSGDGQNFETIGTVNSKAVNGYSTIDLSYNFVDENPQIGHNYYKLEQVDFDNSMSYTKVIDIVWGADGSVVSIYPNPAKDILNIDLSVAQTVQTEIKLLDMSGRVVKSILSQSVKGMNHMTLDLSNIAVGVYGVQVFENNKLTHVSKVRKN
jgi:hypothetical protein